MSYPEQFPVQPEHQHGMPPHGAPVRRPGTVTAACVMAWIFSVIALLLGGLFAISSIVSRDEVIKQIEKDENFKDLDVSAGSLIDGLIGVSVAAVVLSLLAIIFATMAFRGSSAGRILLVLCAVVGAIMALALSVALIPFLWVIGCVVSIVLLFTGGAGPWFKSKKVV